MIRVSDNTSGLPAVLIELLTQVDFAALDYKDRDVDAKSLANWPSKGDHFMAKCLAKQMIERQRNIQNRMNDASKPS